VNDRLIKVKYLNPKRTKYIPSKAKANVSEHSLFLCYVKRSVCRRVERSHVVLLVETPVTPTGSDIGVFTKSCIYSQNVLLRLGEFVTRNMYNWFKKINKRNLLHLVGCLHRCSNDVRSHKYQAGIKDWYYVNCSSTELIQVLLSIVNMVITQRYVLSAACVPRIHGVPTTTGITRRQRKDMKYENLFLRMPQLNSTNSPFILVYNFIL